MGPKSNREKMQTQAFELLKKISSKIDPRTEIAEGKSITHAVGLSALHKLIEKYKIIDEVNTDKKITKKNIKEILEQKESYDVNGKRKYDKRALNGAFNETIFNNWRQFTITNNKSVSDIVSGFPNTYEIQKVIVNQFSKSSYTNPDYNIIGNVIIKFQMFKDVVDKDEPIKLGSFFYHSKISQKLKSINQINEFAGDQVKGLIKRIEEVNQSGSSWRFNKIQILKIQISKSKKTRAGSYIQTPEILKKKRAIINIQNKDDKCIKWAMLCHLYQEEFPKNKQRTDNYKPYWNKVIEPNDITYPIDIQTDIKKFERLNDIKINVFNYDVKDKGFKNLLTLYNSSSRNSRVCNLLLLSENDQEHLVYISNLGGLLRTDTNHEKRYWCSQCLACSFDTEIKLEHHQKICFNYEAVHCIMPKKFEEGDKKKEDVVKFINHNNKFITSFFNISRL